MPLDSLDVGILPTSGTGAAGLMRTRSPFHWDGWGSLALPRINAHRMVVVAAALTTLVAAMLAGALAALGGQALPIAVRHDLSGAGDTALLISGSVSAPDDTRYQALLPGELRRALDGTPFTLYHASWSDPLGFTGTRVHAAGDNLAILDAAALPDVARHAVLVSGSWPGTSAGGDVIPAALPATAAALLHLSAGDTLTLRDRDSQDIVRFRITGLYRESHAVGVDAQYWQLNLISPGGVNTVSGFSTYGPLTVQQAAFSRPGSGARLVQAQASWLAEPRTSLIPPGDFSAIASQLNALDNLLGNPSSSLPSLVLTSRLPSVLTSVAANLDVARSLLAICGVLLALLAGAVLLAVARLLSGQREGETAMLVARGATRVQLLRLTSAEAIPLCVLAAVGGTAAGIWLARLLAPTGPAANAIADAAQAAAVVAGLALVIMLVPAMSLVTPGAARVRRGRQAAISMASRAGADLGLIALAVLTCWQLRHYSAVSAGANGAFGVDPVVVAAPALALAGGTVVALRLLPFGGKAGDRLAARGRWLTAALASWQISRQPIRQGGAALLIVLAVATATLALSQRESWAQSSKDQAAFTAGADVRVQTVQPLTVAQAAAVTSEPGVRQAMPVATFNSASGTSQVLAVGAARADGVALLRPDQSPVPESTLFAKIRGTSQVLGVRLPGSPRELLLTARLGPPSLQLGDASVTASVEDAADVVYQLPPVALPADGRDHTLAVPLTSGAGGTSFPLRLTAITVGYTLPASDTRTHAVLTVSSVADGPDTADALPGSALVGFATFASSAGLNTALSTTGVANGSQPPSVTVARADGPAESVTFGTGFGQGTSGLAGVPPIPLSGQVALTALPPRTVTVMPGIATRSYLAANGARVGSTVQATLDGTAVGVHIVAAVSSFPTITQADGNGSGALIVDLASVQNFLTGSDMTPAPVTQWWLATAHGAVPRGLAAALPGGSAVTSETALASGLLNDPLSDVPQRALLGVAVAALLLASTGFYVSIAAGIRQRRAENALLAALGVTPRRAALQLCLEKFMLSLPSAAAGLALGALLAELLVPAITLSATAAAPEPSVLIEFGWVPTLGTAILLAIVPVLAAALVMLRRPDAAADLRAAEAA
jgi:FtsX-like permease family